VMESKERTIENDLLRRARVPGQAPKPARRLVVKSASTATPTTPKTRKESTKRDKR
jgi:hypothetical protein